MGCTRATTLHAASSYHLPFSICQGAKRHCAGRGHGPECPDKEMKAEAELMEKVRGNLLFCQAVAVFWTPGYRDDMHLVMERCDCDLYTVVIPQDPPDPRRRQLYEDEGQILIRWDAREPRLLCHSRNLPHLPQPGAGRTVVSP